MPIVDDPFDFGRIVATKKNIETQAGDVLILGKRLGVRVLAAALKKGALSVQGYQQMIATATQINTVGTELSGLKAVHALTDVTGFGLLGHLLEMCHGSGLGAELEFDRMPILSEALLLVQQGYGPGAIERNLASYGHEVDFAANLENWQQRMLKPAAACWLRLHLMEWLRCCQPSRMPDSHKQL